MLARVFDVCRICCIPFGAALHYALAWKLQYIVMIEGGRNTQWQVRTRCCSNSWPKGGPDIVAVLKKALRRL
eukprot:901053-Amphidinium_carterae.1